MMKQVTFPMFCAAICLVVLGLVLMACGVSRPEATTQVGTQIWTVYVIDAPTQKCIRIQGGDSVVMTLAPFDACTFTPPR